MLRRSQKGMKKQTKTKNNKNNKSLTEIFRQGCKGNCTHFMQKCKLSWRHSTNETMSQECILGGEGIHKVCALALASTEPLARYEEFHLFKVEFHFYDVFLAASIFNFMFGNFT